MLRLLIWLIFIIPSLGYPQFPIIIDIGNQSEDIRIIYKTDDNDNKDNFASSLAIGDFNGDGFNDILAGTYGYSDAKNLRFNVGRAYIIFGGSELSPIIDLRNPTVKHVTITGDDPMDNTGWCVGAGDVNRDGITDAIIGDFQVGDVAGPGKLYVAYGKANWPENIDLNTDGKPVEGITRFVGKKAADSFGGRIAVGDINGDGYDDITTAAANLGSDYTLKKAGEVYVIFGQDSFKSVLSIDDPSITVTTIESVEGWAIGRGYCVDINQDGYSDLFLINTYLKRKESGESVAMIKIFYGSKNWPIRFLIDSQNTESVTTMQINGVANEGMWWRFRVGDINGNGINDLLLPTAWNYKIYFLFDLPENVPLIEIGNYPNKLILSQYGREGDLTIADLNSDGYADCITASPDAPIDEKRNGRAYIIYGSENLPDSLNMNDEKDLTSVTQILNSQVTTRFGYAMTTGDMNNDGIDDLVLSDYEAHTTGGASVGEIYIIYGRSSSSQKPPVGKSVLLQNFPNPFNANTIIRYQLKNPQMVRITIYNARGQEVRQLVEGFVEAGEHKAIWDGYDSNLLRVGSGVYICRLVGEQFTESMKLLYLK